jgi:transposase
MGDGRPLPPHLKAQIGRELDRLGLLIEQIKAVEAERDVLFVPTTNAEHVPAVTNDVDRPRRDRTGICRRSIGGPSLHRSFANRKQVSPSLRSFDRARIPALGR